MPVNLATLEAEKLEKRMELDRHLESILRGVEKQATDVMLTPSASPDITKVANAVACLAATIRFALTSSERDR